MNLENKGKVALNLVDLVPLPDSSESKQVVPANVVTRAQAKQQEPTSSINFERGKTRRSWRARNRQREAKKKAR